MNRDPSQQAYAVAVGTTSTNYPIFDKRDPSPNDTNYQLGKFWINQTGFKLWYLNSQSNASGVLQSNWQLVANSTGLQSLSDTSGGVVYPSSINNIPPQNIQLVGTNGITITSDPNSNSLTIEASNSDFTLQGDIGSVSGSTISLLGSTGSAQSGSSVKFVAASATELDLRVTDNASNTLVGRFAGNSTLTGNANHGFGYANLFNVTTGSSNASFGFSSLFNLSSGNYNTAMGSATLSNCNGNYNTGIGYTAGQLITSGSNNTSLGAISLQQLTSGSNNISIGFSSGSNYQSSESNNIILGSLVSGTTGESNTIRIGNSSSTSCIVTGISGVTTSNSNMVTINTVTGQLGSAPVPPISPVLLTSKVTLTSTQIKSLSGTPITLIAAPGSDMMINVVACSYRFKYGGSNQFTGGSTMNIYVNSAVSVNYVCAQVFSTGIINGTQITAGTRYPSSIGTSFAGVDTTNQPVIISVAGADYAGNAANDNTLEIQIAYFISNL